MRQQLEDDLCIHLRDRIRRVIEDHRDTCRLCDVDDAIALQMAIAMLMAEAIAFMRVDGGTVDDVLQVIGFVKQKIAATQ